MELTHTDDRKYPVFTNTTSVNTLITPNINNLIIWLLSSYGHCVKTDSNCSLNFKWVISKIHVILLHTIYLSYYY